VTGIQGELSIVMLILTPRFVLRDFMETDRAAFISYQMDPRYRRLYDISDFDDRQAQELFDRFTAWQKENPRRNFQLGVFQRSNGRLCGSAGLRDVDRDQKTAILGIELTPDDWGRYRLAIDVVSALLEHGFLNLDLHTISGQTASGNRRVERLARWFGAQLIEQGAGPEWMTTRGWQEVVWTVPREDWVTSKSRQRLTAD
jgi:ribosomal-protein-alanine N-acetyltransferase